MANLKLFDKTLKPQKTELNEVEMQHHAEQLLRQINQLARLHNWTRAQTLEFIAGLERYMLEQQFQVVRPQ